MKNNEQQEKVVNSKKQLLKNSGLLLGYWLIFIIMPFFIAKTLYSLEIYSVSKLFYYYLIIVAPFLVFIPIRIAKFKNNFQLIVFLLLGFIPACTLSYYVIVTLIRGISVGRLVGM